MMKLAKGEKVLDDPKLLKKSLKRAQKDKKKSKEGWKVRTDAVRKKQSDTQNKYVPLISMTPVLTILCHRLETMPLVYPGDRRICRRRWTQRRLKSSRKEKKDFSAQDSKGGRPDCGHERLLCTKRSVSNNVTMCHLRSTEKTQHTT